MAGGNYGKVRITFWTDPDIKRKLTAEQKTLLLYYFSSPHGNMIGLYYCPPMFAAEETGIPVERVREWTAGPLAPFVSYDEETEEVFIRKLAEHQVGAELKEGDKRIPAVVKALREVHSEGLLRDFLTTYAGWPLGITPPEVPPKGHGRGIQELAADTGSPSESSSSSSSSSSNTPITELHSSPIGEAAEPGPELVEVEEIEPEQPTAFNPPPGAVAVLQGDRFNEDDRISPGEIVGAWLRTRATRPPATVIMENAGFAKTLSDRYTAGQLVRAFIGITQIWPHAGPKGEPWNLFDLDKRIDKAIAAFEQHPERKRQRNYEEFLREIGRAA